MTQPTSLFRFVQLRRLPAPEPGGCPHGLAAAAAAVDFTGDLSQPVQEALSAADAQRARALFVQRRGALGADGTRAARLVLALLRAAAVDERLTLGALRTRLQAGLATAGLGGERGGQAVQEATVWAVDVLTLRRWLRPGVAVGSSEPGRILRGVVLVRLARSQAEDPCVVRRLVAGRALSLPPVPTPGRPPRPEEERARRFGAARRDLDRLLLRREAATGDGDPTLADLAASPYPDLRDALHRLERTAQELGLPPTTRARDAARVLDAEGAAAQRVAGLLRTTATPMDPGTFDPTQPTSGVPWLPVPPTVPVLTAEVRVLGRGDLMLVRTTHLRYDLGEISHVENVLASEVRERTNVYDTETREVVTTSESTLDSRSQDLETTEQSGLERAVDSAVSTDTAMSLGVSVSGGLGPVQAGVDIDASRSTSTELSTSSSISYAKTVTEKASELLRTETSVRRTTATRTRITETNLHEFDNAAGAENIAGIYRWLDKVDSAQVYNYGERLMLEFVVPEPAAQLVALAETTDDTGDPVPPEEWDLELDDVTEHGYVDQAARWNVLGLDPPPASHVLACASFADPAARPFDYEKNSTDKSQPEWGYTSYVNEVAIPEGYSAQKVNVAVTWSLSRGEYDAQGGSPPQGVYVAVGGQVIGIDDSGTTDRTIELAGRQAGPLAVGLSADQRGGLTATFRVHCVRTDEALDAWRLRTYETIRAGYLALKNAYDTALATSQARAAYAATTPSDVNRALEARELKRGCQTILSGQDFDLFGALDLAEDDLPRIDVAEALAEADDIQFFEDLFEWENVVYLFYGYQWAGRERWTELLSRTSSDPLHQAFLQAGAARVIVPVRSGYERAVGRYLATSEVPTPSPASWRGGPSPYPPITELVADALDRPGDEVAVGDPWEVVTPTTLVLLQADATLNPAPDAPPPADEPTSTAARSPRPRRVTRHHPR